MLEGSVAEAATIKLSTSVSIIVILSSNIGTCTVCFDFQPSSLKSQRQLARANQNPEQLERAAICQGQRHPQSSWQAYKLWLSLGPWNTYHTFLTEFSSNLLKEVQRDDKCDESWTLHFGKLDLELFQHHLYSYTGLGGVQAAYQLWPWDQFRY